MISSLVQQICSALAQVWNAVPIPQVGDAFDAICGQFISLLQGFGL